VALPPDATTRSWAKIVPVVMNKSPNIVVFFIVTIFIYYKITAMQKFDIKGKP
jgi:hypothetical protein